MIKRDTRVNLELKANERQRREFVIYWAEYVRTHSDREWSRQQNVLINSILGSAKQFSREEYLGLERKAKELKRECERD